MSIHFSRSRLIPAVLLLTLAAGCARRPIVETRTLMGTEVTITVYSYDSHKLRGKQVETAIDEAFREINRIEDLAKWGQLRMLNAFAGSQSYPIGEELITLIDQAYYLSANTGGAFRPDLGPLVDLWGVGTKNARIPAYWEIEDALDIISQTAYTVEDSITSRLDPSGASLDLGGVAKGYAVDRACGVLQKLGITAAMVWAGGDLKVFGHKPDDSPWRIAVRHPRDLEGYAAIIEFRDELAVATSGDYERYFEVDGGRYHHIFDPTTGYPAWNSISATAVASTCTDADAYATGLFVLGPERGVELAVRLDIPAFIMAEHNGRITQNETQSFTRMRAGDDTAAQR